jgi:hypothetical protein
MYPRYAGVPERIAATLPGVRFVYVLRDPIERMQSMYVHRVRRGRETRPIDDAFTEDPLYADTSCYAMQLDQFTAYFAQDRFLLVRTDDLARDREATVRRVCSFVGVDPSRLPARALRSEKNVTAPQSVRVAVARRLRRLPAPDVPSTDLRDATRAGLVERLRADAERLRDRWGVDVLGWPTFG